MYLIIFLFYFLLFQLHDNECPQGWSMCDPLAINKQCYPSNLWCVYGLYIFTASHTYCAEQLYNCEGFQCPHMFKCQGSIRICVVPALYVCI